MADNPAAATSVNVTTPSPSAPARSRLRPWVIGLVVTCAVVALGAWWFSGRKVRVWGDGESSHAADPKAASREVVWTQPESLGDDVNTPDQEYEPSVSPDGTE